MTGPADPRPDDPHERRGIHPVMTVVLAVLGVTLLALFGWALT